MRKLSVIFSCMLIMLLATACGPSLRDVFSTSQNYYSATTATTQVEVDVAAAKIKGADSISTSGKIIQGVNLANAVAHNIINAEQERRLQNLIDTAVLAANVHVSFNEVLTSNTQLPAVEANSRPDLRILISIREYGIFTKNPGDPINYFVKANVSVIQVSTMKSIYEDSATLTYTPSDFVRADGILGRYANGTIGNIMNIVQFFMLSDEEIVNIFDYLGSYTGATLADRLTKEIYN